ncbi:hypothetical protein [Bradyrhizobium sp. SRS-191]|uniref:hypothetical protein n=1 Tax=Bradyrhizobium sp. SRS-191 TaxID=2962606 RepID=UPI00211E123F|nr:hypothetical protein [Bradyrhizobium sp. SRS-191]
MPFIYDESEREWHDEDSDPPDPRASDFVYLPAPEFGGQQEPVPFSLLTPAGETAAAPADAAPAMWSIFYGLFSRRRSSAQISREILDNQQRQQLLFGLLVPPLRAAGVKRAYCRYDGGHDEGFSWLDHYENEAGDRLDLDALVARLLDMGVHDQLRRVKSRFRSAATFKHQKLAELRAVISDEVVEEWAMLLFGGGYGTGEYCMYGAFWVDLEACTIIDDRKADPIVQNITIAK